MQEVPSAFHMIWSIQYLVFLTKLTLNIFSTSNCQKTVEQVKLKFANIYKTINIGKEKRGEIKHIDM